MFKTLNILGVTFLTLLFSNVIHAQEVGRSIIVIGDAWVLYGNNKTKLTPGHILRQSDIIVTGKRGRVRLSMSDGSRVYISPRTRISLKQYATKGSTLIARFDMFWGKARFWVKKLATRKSRFNVHTTTAVIGVRGTVYDINTPRPKNADSMAFDPQLSLDGLPPAPTNVSLESGAVVVTGSDGSQQTLAPGEQLSVSKSGEVSSPTPSESTNSGDAEASGEEGSSESGSSSGGDSSNSNFANSSAASTAASAGVTQGVTITTPYTYGTPQPASP